MFKIYEESTEFAWISKVQCLIWNRSKKEEKKEEKKEVVTKLEITLQIPISTHILQFLFWILAADT